MISHRFPVALNRYHKHKALSWVLLLLLTGEVFPEAAATDTIVATAEGSGPRLVGKNIFILENQSETFTIEDILKPEAQRGFHRNERDVIVRGLSERPLWLKLDVQNKSEGPAWVELGSIHIWFADYYAPERGQYRLVAQGGSLRKIPRRYNSQLTWFPLPGTREIQTVYIRVTGQMAVPLPVWVGTTHQLSERKTRNDYLVAGFTGIVIVMILFNLSLLVLTRDKIYTWYILYLIAALFTATLLRHYPIIGYLFPALSDFFIVHPSWRNTPLIFLGFFAIEFLGLRSFPGLKRGVLIILFVLIVVIPLQDIFRIIPGLPLSVINRPAFIISGFYLLATSVLVWLLRRDRSGAYFTFAWTGALAGSMIQILNATGFLPLNLFTENAVLFGIGLETTLFSFALADRLKRANEKLLSRNTKLLRQSSIMAKIGGWEFLPAEDRFYWSDVTRAMYEAPEDFVPRPANAFQFYEDRKSRLIMARAFTKCRESGAAYDVELKLKSFRGREVWIRTIGEAEFENGRCIRIFGTCQDITDSKETELKLIAARRAAEVAARAKSSFLATMSHEIRTPMSGVIGMASLLAETELDENQRRYVEILNRSGENLLALINDILDFSRIEAGKVVLSAEPFDPAALCRDVSDLMAPKAQQRGNVTDTTIDPAIHYKILGDEMRLKQVLSNLVGNAVKFTDNGAILLSVREITRTGDTVELEFVVADTGIGIPADKIDQLFQPFMQVDGSIARRYGGTGLGLSICQRLVDLMRGKISLESKVGSGTRVRLKIPFSVAGNEPADSGPADNAEPGLRQIYSALIVDDDPVVREIMAQMLARLGFTIQTAADGAEAVEKCRTTEFDFITMDTNMPLVSGYDAIKEIRQISGSPDFPVIISVSAAVGPAEAAQAIQTGANDIMTKPFTFSAVRDTMQRWIIDARQKR